ncbi:methyltransferase domain-containing protein [Stagnimonas aquatica]|uniref:Methyltransferase domain-containing protein n=1 Tax=Stagnimonas aquatica TaxID=2689987 RepID=A0A3N0VER6_9GAMM|nr:methyltransferase domain-containing protein [Stagnimonas aquatica]ROH91165.1 methyltransferase domain-containing protein [Stagnimonas aquatica]
MPSAPPASPSKFDPTQRWADSTHGRRLTSLEREEVARHLPELFGRHFLQIGAWGGEGDWLSGSEMLHRAVLAVGKQPGAQARVDAQHLPLASKSVDAVLLPHTLELVRSPHRLLRETSRVLSDRGRLLLVGFSPWGSLAWRRRVGLAPRALPGSSRYYSAGRVCDWLSLLDFEVLEVRRFGVGFPWLPARSDGNPFTPASLFQVFSEAYLVAAKKRVTPLTLVGQRSRAQVKPLIGLPGVAAHRDGSQ